MGKISEEETGVCRLREIYAKSIFLEHDYSVSFSIDNHNNNNVNEENVNKENLSGTNNKFRRAFHAVDKWADNVILRASTGGGDKKKIVDREISIHKVKYPFLPEQQIRGKVYKKFGIPAVMGGVLSRYVSSLGASGSKERSSNQKRSLKKIDRAKAAQEITEYSRKCYPPAADKKQSTIFEITEKKRSNKSNSPIIRDNNTLDSSMNISNRTSNCPRSVHQKSPTASSKEKVSLENSPPLVSPLKLDELSREDQFTLPPRVNRKRVNLQKLSIPFAHDEFSSGPKNSDSRIQDEISHEPVSVYSQQTQIAASYSPRENPTSAGNKFPMTSGSIEESTTKIKLSEISMEINLEDMPTQICESLGKKNVCSGDTRENCSSEAARSRGKKRKISAASVRTMDQISPPNKLFKSNEDINEKLRSLPVISNCKNTSHSEINDFRAQSPDSVILDHSYSGTMKMSRVRSEDSKIEKNPDGKFAKNERAMLENSLRMEKNDFGKYKCSREKENMMDHFSCAERDERIFFDELPRWSKNIISSPDGSLPVAKKETNFVPWRADYSRFLVVNSLANRCCEYDLDAAKITTNSESANNLSDDETLRENLKINSEEYKIREKIDEILGFLENDCEN